MDLITINNLAYVLNYKIKVKLIIIKVTKIKILLKFNFNKILKTNFCLISNLVLK